ncbi:flavin reductase family protein [Oceanibacterium hippocampi]|uniref:Flavin reductase like domain protein n=1 Tax=Oceanibacterium hippocampi TaxID=745714 RepID=A0A1Y5SA31_9PROT|nr:flavin reductase family protein [Oceanibacterium hippocampi]SLN34802.1 Flavin reductase like domain protein [Oceanibacterium hippocampi]
MFYKTDGPHGLPHNPFKAVMVPRPIGWFSSLDAEGNCNLAPYSFFNAMASDPPVVVFGHSGRSRHGTPKDSMRNIEETKEFVCNIATWETREAMNASAAMVERDVDEFALAGLTPVPSTLVRPPRVAESPVHFECVYLQTVHLPSDDPANFNAAVFGQVVGVHIDESILTDGVVDMKKFRPIARLGASDYAVVDHVFAMRRPA